MRKAASASAVLAVGATLAAVGYWAGRTTADREASRYLFDVTSHMALSCANEHVVALADIGEGKTEDAVRGLELLVAAKLSNLELERISETTIAKASLSDLRGPLTAYLAQSKSPILDPKTNPRLNDLVGARP